MLSNNPEAIKPPDPTALLKAKAPVKRASFGNAASKKKSKPSKLGTSLTKKITVSDQSESSSLKRFDYNIAYFWCV